MNREAQFLSIVSTAELKFGALRSANPQANIAIVWKFCDAFRVVSLDHVAAERSAIVRAQLENAGAPIGAYDVLIAGIALAHGHALATHNVREFARVPGPQIEDWATI